eukprot:sb/3477194/
MFVSLSSVLYAVLHPVENPITAFFLDDPSAFLCWCVGAYDRRYMIGGRQFFPAGRRVVCSSFLGKVGLGWVCFLSCGFGVVVCRRSLAQVLYWFTIQPYHSNQVDQAGKK